MSLLTFARNRAQSITYPFIVSLITLAAGASAMPAALHAMRCVAAHVQRHGP
jgi:hypothetical protein